MQIAHEERDGQRERVAVLENQCARLREQVDLLVREAASGMAIAECFCAQPSVSYIRVAAAPQGMGRCEMEEVMSNVVAHQQAAAGRERQVSRRVELGVLHCASVKHFAGLQGAFAAESVFGRDYRTRRCGRIH